MSTATETNPADIEARFAELFARVCTMGDDRKCALAFCSFLGSLSVLIEPTSIINEGPTRENIASALETAINSQTEGQS